MTIYIELSIFLYIDCSQEKNYTITWLFFDTEHTYRSSLMSAVQVYVGHITYTKDNHEGKSSVNDFWIIHGTVLPLHLCK